MSRKSVSILCALIFCLIPLMVQADSHRMETSPTAWWWYHGQSYTDINDRIAETGARLTDIEIQSTEPLRFSAAFVHNSGVYAETWWWYFDQTASDVATLLDRNHARLIDIERYETDGGPRFAVVMLDNSGADSVAWWWYFGATASTLEGLLDENDARLVDIEAYQDGGTRYAAIMVDNSGPDAMDWWWYYNVPASTITASLSSNGSRLLEYEVRDPVAGTFDAILIPNTETDNIHWWWYYHVTEAQLNALASQNGARISDLDTYLHEDTRRFSVVMLNNSNALTTKMGTLLGYGEDGATGVYLKEVGGPVLASLQPDFVHEPSSSLKVTHHLYTMRRVMFGEDDLNNHLLVAEGLTGSCPTDGPPFNDQSLSETLGGMMWDSDNTDTRAIELRYGRAAINDTSRSLVGMGSTSINRRMGCAELPLNDTTLRDITGLYEGVAQGLYLDPFHRDVFYLLMQSENTSDPWWFTGQLENLVHEVAADLGIPEAAAEYWDNTRLVWKPGDDHFGYATYDRFFRSVSGWVSLPWNCADSEPSEKELVFGLFIHDARNDDYCRSRYFNNTIELFREQVTAGLIACVSAVDDHSTPSRVPLLHASYPNPFNPHTIIAFDLPRDMKVSLWVYDVSGRLVDVLLDDQIAREGRNEIIWRGRDRAGRELPSGTYFYRVRAGDVFETRRMMLIK